MRRASLLVIAGFVALAGCGDDDETDRASSKPAAAVKEDSAPGRTAEGTTITLGKSDFGSMLFDSRKQAIYIFQRDQDGRSVCYGACAEAWPPVLTKGKPRASSGVKQALLGTIKRRDGKQQVTYGGKPLYFYAHESPGEVRCHNVDLNGGLWWVIGPDGERRA